MSAPPPDDGGGGGGGATNNNNATTPVYRATVFEAGLRQFSSLLRRPGGGGALPGAARQLNAGADAVPTAAMYAGGGLAPPANPPLLRPSPSGPLPASAAASAAAASPPAAAGAASSSAARQQQAAAAAASAPLARSQSADAATVAAGAAGAAGATTAAATTTDASSSNHRVRRFLRILHGPAAAAALDPSAPSSSSSSALIDDPAVVDLDALREAAWSGVPPSLRPQVWRLLLGYTPPSRARQQAALARRRREYLELAQELCGEHAAAERSEDEAALQRQVAVDCPRTAPGEAFVRDERVQLLLARLLYVWGVRHPASGYVQGMNDIVTPFLAVFLGERLGNMVARTEEAATAARDAAATAAPPSSSASSLLPPPPPPMADWPALLPKLPDSELAEAEADSYWCLSRMLESIQDHYTYAQPGIQRAVFRVRELLSHGGVGRRLAAHLDAQGLDNYLQFAFRWVNCLLAREVPFSLAVRLWDTYLAEEGAAAGGGGAGGGGGGRGAAAAAVAAGSAAAAAAASGGGAGGGTGTGRGLAEFLVYACAAFLAAWERELLACADFQELLLFLQRPPTANWGERDVETLLSRAYVWMRGYSGAQGHLRGPASSSNAAGGAGGG
jgi:hypothetical protein